MSAADSPTAGSPTQSTVLLESILTSREAVVRLSQQQVSLPAAQHVLRLKLWADDLAAGFSKRRDAIVAEKGTLISDGPQKRWKLEADQVEEAQAAVEKIVKEAVDVPKDVYLSPDVLQEFKVSAEDLERLSPLIKD